MLGSNELVEPISGFGLLGNLPFTMLTVVESTRGVAPCPGILSVWEVVLSLTFILSF